jgi:hypothetical protein
MSGETESESIGEGGARLLQDRRRRPTPAISRYTFFGGRRKSFRRVTDGPGYTDRYPRSLLLLLCGILVLSIADALCTLLVIHHHGGSEANPMMQWALSCGILPFLTTKLVLTSGGVLILCLHYHFPMVRFVIGLSLAAYVLVSVYHLYLLYIR